jgi:type II secretory pathway pseudopilin PulG
VDAKGPFDRAFLGDRAMGLDTFEMIKSEGLGDLSEGLSIAELMGGEIRSGWSPLSWLYGSRFGRPFLNNDEVVYLRLMRGQIEVVNNAPPGERAKRASELETSIPNVAVVARMMAPVFARSVDKRDQATVNLGLFEIALQVELYRAQRGEWPADMQALQDSIGDALPEDPFARAPYHYRRETDGFVIWSLGTDLDDDDGHGPKDPGFDYDNCDITWKLAR